MVYFGAFLCNFVMEYLSAWKELQFGIGIKIFSSSISSRGTIKWFYIWVFSVFFVLRRIITKNYSFFAKNATYTYNQKICFVILFLVETSSTSTKKFLLTHKNIFSYQKFFFPLLPPFSLPPKILKNKFWGKSFHLLHLKSIIIFFVGEVKKVVIEHPVAIKFLIFINVRIMLEDSWSFFVI